MGHTVYPKKYAHGFCFAVLCCGYTLTEFPISIRLTSLALWQSNDCPSASKATLMYMDKYFTWIHYERLHNHNKAKHNKTVCIFLGIYCTVDTDKPISQMPPCTFSVSNKRWLRTKTRILFVQNDTLCDVGQLYCVICELGQLWSQLNPGLSQMILITASPVLKDSEQMGRNQSSH